MKFSIRDVLWITLAVGIGLGWFTHIKTYEAQIRTLKNQQNHNLLERISQDAILIEKLNQQLSKRDKDIVQLNSDKDALRNWHMDWINVGLRQEAEIDRLTAELKKAAMDVEKTKS